MKSLRCEKCLLVNEVIAMWGVSPKTQTALTALITYDEDEVNVPDTPADAANKKDKGMLQLHIISLVSMGETGGHVLKDFKREEEKRKRKTAGGEEAKRDFLL